MAKRLTLQIDRPCFKDILNGVQKVEHRFIYPNNVKKYVLQTELPDDGTPVQCVKYDELYLINGRRKDAPRLTVEVKDARFIVFTDENGEPLVYTENDYEYITCQVWYYLGEVKATENVPADYWYGADEKAQRLALVAQDEADMEKSIVQG